MRLLLTLMCLGCLASAACSPNPYGESGPLSVNFWPITSEPLLGLSGSKLRLTLGARPDKQPGVAVGDPATAEVSVTPMDWNLYRVDVQLLKPGAVRLIADVTGDRAEALLASLDPETTSRPVPLPSGLPVQALGHPSEARLITEAGAWQAFVHSVSQVSDVVPPVAFADRALVAVVTSLTPDAGTPVVTHVASGPTPTITVVVPEIESKMGRQGDRQGVITLLEIAKVSADAHITLETLRSMR